MLSLNDTNVTPLHCWYVYIIQTKSNRLYTGITNDIQRRWQAHLSGKSGAKFLRADKPEKLVFVETALDRSVASKREAEIKRLPRKDKLILIRHQGPVYFPNTVKKP